MQSFHFLVRDGTRYYAVNTATKQKAYFKSVVLANYFTMEIAGLSIYLFPSSIRFRKEHKKLIFGADGSPLAPIAPVAIIGPV